MLKATRVLQNTESLGSESANLTAEEESYAKRMKAKARQDNLAGKGKDSFYDSEYDEEESDLKKPVAESKEEEKPKKKRAAAESLYASKKPPLYNKHPMEWDVNIQTRLGVPDALFNGIKEKEPFINKMLMNQVIPK